MSTSNLSALPLLQQWKNRNHRNNSQSLLKRNNIKFQLISKQSLPFLQHSKIVKKQLFKGFRKNAQKQNSSYHVSNRKSPSNITLPLISEAEKFEQQKQNLKLVKLKNKRNHQREKLRLEYENLRINSIIECAAEDLIQKQNKMLNGMI